MHPSPESLRAPHPPLERYYASEAERRAYVLGLFNRTAGDYDRIEWMLSWGSGAWYRRRAVLRAGLSAGMRVIDVGVGTGLVARAACTIVGDPSQVTGVDPSESMLAHARLPAGVRLLKGCAEAIPADASCADFLTMGYALRHISDLSVAFGEFARVLKPGGRLCMLEISAPGGAAARALLRFYLRGIIPLVAALFTREPEMPRLMRYYWDTIESCAAPEAIMAALSAAGLTQVKRHVELGIFSEYSATKPPGPGAISQSDTSLALR